MWDRENGRFQPRSPMRVSVGGIYLGRASFPKTPKRPIASVLTKGLQRGAKLPVFAVSLASFFSANSTNGLLSPRSVRAMANRRQRAACSRHNEAFTEVAKTPLQQACFSG